jgi:uncharacterized protein
MGCAMNNTYLALMPDQMYTVRKVLDTCAPGQQALAFGSRVRQGTVSKPLKPHADLDIALTGSHSPAHGMFALREAFSESDLPFRVDVVIRDDLPVYWLDAIDWYPLAV